MAINWLKAPEGTTHGTENASAIRGFGPWRKVTKDKVYYYKDGDWEARNIISTVNDYLRFNKHLVARPAPVEAPLPNGLVWPEGFTYYNPNHRGFFFNDVGYVLVRAKLDGLKEWFDGAFAYWLVDDKTISRYGEGVVVVKEAAPIVKKKVGWW